MTKKEVIKGLVVKELLDIPPQYGFRIHAVSGGAVRLETVDTKGVWREKIDLSREQVHEMMQVLNKYIKLGENND